KPLSPRQHINLLRCAIVGVAIFAFIFGALFPLIEYVHIWWSITQAIFTGGAGAAIIGGLYWRRGTTAGAWTGLIIGSTLSIGSIAYLLHPWSNAAWANYWFVVAICFPLVIAVATTIWFTIGCWRDMRLFFKRLREESVDSTDDGSVRQEPGSIASRVGPDRG